MLWKEVQITTTLEAEAVVNVFYEVSDGVKTRPCRMRF